MQVAFMEEIGNDIFGLCCSSCCREREREREREMRWAVKDSMRSREDIVPPFLLLFSILLLLFICYLSMQWETT
jgi:hypothetical protein